MLTPGTCEHLIITRFSVRFVPGEDCFPRAWLEDRLRLLEAFCLPGLAAQTRSGFKWLVLCDEFTDPNCLAALDGLMREVADSSVILTSTERSSHAEVLRHVDPAAEVLITTRLDSDDGLAVDFVERVQNYVAPFLACVENRLQLSFSQGQTLELDSGAVYDSFQPNGPFLSLFERMGAELEPRTVYSGNHGRLYLENPLHIDGSHAAWLQVVHGRNISNHVRNIDLPTTETAPEAQFVIRPAAARGLSGVAAPHAARIKASGEKGTEGLAIVRDR